ncbi:hypothetical protein MHK_009564, partial [Candidatus Magnetomorum sp. HK-1]
MIMNNMESIGLQLKTIINNVIKAMELKFGAVTIQAQVLYKQIIYNYRHSEFIASCQSLQMVPNKKGLKNDREK